MKIPKTIALLFIVSGSSILAMNQWAYDMRQRTLIDTIHRNDILNAVNLVNNGANIYHPDNYGIQPIKYTPENSKIRKVLIETYKKRVIYYENYINSKKD